MCCSPEHAEGFAIDTSAYRLDRHRWRFLGIRATSVTLGPRIAYLDWFAENSTMDMMDEMVAAQIDGRQ